MSSSSRSAKKIARQIPSHNSAFYGLETDIVIPIIGPIGAGKSTFINIALGNDNLKVGHGVNPCTNEPWPVVVDKDLLSLPNMEGHRLVLVDTPGFDNTDPSKSDSQILKQIETWLEQSYPQKAAIGGVLYIHDITIKKFKAADRRIIDIFHKKHGDSTRNVILATTNWGPPPPENSENIEAELKNTHWLATIKKGAKVHRFLGDSHSAQAIIVDLLRRMVEPQKAKKDGFDIREFFRGLSRRLQEGGTVQ